jgi:hypothetical protein
MLLILVFTFNHEYLTKKDERKEYKNDVITTRSSLSIEDYVIGYGYSNPL